MLEKSNYKFNRSVPFKQGLINGQLLSPIGRMRFGLAHISGVGSGVVAAYNLFLMLNHPVPPAELIRDIYSKARTPFGIFGVHPTKLFHCFASKYIPVSIEKDIDAFSEKFTDGSCGIVVWYNGRPFVSSVRFAAIEKDHGRIYAYNRFPDSRKRFEFTRIRDLADDRHFIAGYHIKIR